MSHREDAEKLRSLIKGIRIAFLVTLAPDGTIRGRPMATQHAEFDGDLWFFTDRDSHKVDEINLDRHVSVCYADPDGNRYVWIAGRAEVVLDKAKAKELWNPGAKAWYPKGPDDPALALLRVRVENAEYWDGPSSKMVQLAGFVKAVATGTRIEAGENKKLNIDPGAKPV